MRLMLFFDLPVKTKKDRRAYANFRKDLIRKGYMMIQYSVYVKIFANRDSATNHIKILKRDLPKKGQIRIMLYEKQYANGNNIRRPNAEQHLTSEVLVRIQLII